jgi:hypothetical protein
MEHRRGGNKRGRMINQRKTSDPELIRTVYVTHGFNVGSTVGANVGFREGEKVL